VEIPRWHVKGDWFDVCNCNIPCPCTFAQAPSYETCDGVLAFHIQEGHYGQVRLDGLNLVRISRFQGNIWVGQARGTVGVFIDQRADEQQREAMRTIFSGQAGGFPAMLAGLFVERSPRGVEYVPIEYEVAADLAYWRVEIPGRVIARGEALSGPTTPPGKRVQLTNAPGSETGPGQVATWGRAAANQVDAFGFQWEWSGRSSKHIPFDWTGPD
jgi:hypothetical protein